MLEEKVAAGLNKVLTTVLSWIEKIFAKDQKKTDFRPKDEEFSSEYATKACQNVTSFVKTQREIIINSLDGKNVEVFIREFGMRLLGVILKHVKKFTITQGLGGLALMRDLTEYQNCITIFNDEYLTQQYDVLKSLYKLHLVGPAQIRDLIQESSLSTLKKDELEEFVRQRSDYSSQWVGKYI